MTGSTRPNWFTQELSMPDGDIVEDRMVAVMGSYSRHRRGAVASMVAFRTPVVGGGIDQPNKSYAQL